MTNDRGSASIEVVGLLPLVAVVILAIVQGGAAIYTVQGALPRQEAARDFSTSPVHAHPRLCRRLFSKLKYCR